MKIESPRCTHDDASSAWRSSARLKIKVTCCEDRFWMKKNNSVGIYCKELQVRNPEGSILFHLTLFKNKQWVPSRSKENDKGHKIPERFVTFRTTLGHVCCSTLSEYSEKPNGALINILWGTEVRASNWEALICHYRTICTHALTYTAEITVICDIFIDHF